MEIEEILKAIGPRIRDLRKGKKLSQQDVANFLGIGRPNLSKIEHGEIVPTLKHILRLCELFNVSTEYLITGQKITINLPDFKEMTGKVNEMLAYMGKNESFLHGMLSDYFLKKQEYLKLLSFIRRT